METKELKIIDKEYLKNTIINLDKSFLSKKYALITETEAIENKIKKIIGTNNSEQLENPDIDDIIGIRINNINKISKHFVEQLPNPNEADENGLYIIQDKNSIDEVCKFFVCIVVVQDDLKKWAIVSSPSPILETEDINFKTEFGYCKNKEDTVGKQSFYNFNELKTYIISKSVQKQGSTADGGGINGLFCELFYKNNNKVKKIQIIISDGDNLYFKYTEQIFYKKIDNSEADTFAQSVINPDSINSNNTDYNTGTDSNDNNSTNTDDNTGTDSNDNNSTNNGGNNK